MTPTPPPKRVGGPLWVWIVGAIAVLAGLISLAPPPDPKEAAANEEQWRLKRKIDFCWEEQARKSMKPEVQRFVASVCENLEADYFRQYGRYYTKYGKKP